MAEQMGLKNGREKEMTMVNRCMKAVTVTRLSRDVSKSIEVQYEWLVGLRPPSGSLTYIKLLDRVALMK